MWLVAGGGRCTCRVQDLAVAAARVRQLEAKVKELQAELVRRACSGGGVNAPH